MAKNRYRKITSTTQAGKVSFFSTLFFQWMNILLKTGSERAIDENDLLPLEKENTSCFLAEELRAKWAEETTNSKKNDIKPKLWKSILKVLTARDIIILISAMSVWTLCRILQPLLLGYLVKSLITAELHNMYLLYGSAIALGINEFISSVGMHHFDYQCEVLGIRVSSALKGLVYMKTLLLSKDSLLRLSSGRVIDLVSNDVQRLEGDTFLFLFDGARSIIELLIVTFLLVYFIGWQALLGIILLCMTLPCYLGFAHAGAVLRLRTAEVSDRRITLINQVVTGIRAIKTNAWEDEYRKKIKNTRSHEINFVRKKSAVLSGIAALEYISTPTATLVTVITLVLTGQSLTPVIVFTLLSFFNLLRLGVCMIVSYASIQTYDAYVSLTRIQEFLLLNNLNSTNTAINHRGVREDMFSPGISTENQEVAILRVRNFNQHQLQNYSKDESFQRDIDFTAKKGSLTVITGSVGSGKSTLLSAIAGEIPDQNWAITYNGTVVYVPQIAWIFSGTIRENILFGEQYEEWKYNRVIEACALTEDIEKFPDCDQTIVGERGVVLSGGQRARVSLARAVYAEGELYLLDDPFSALDLKVAQHIFRECIKGLLGQKTRLLTTHHERVIRDADDIIVLCKGRILGKGSLTELKENGKLNTTVDSLHEKANEADGRVGKENEDDHQITDLSGGSVPHEVRGLSLSEEDRAIGAVSSDLYWNYFTIGVPSLVIIAGICLCVISQVMLVSCDVWLSLLTKKYPEDQKSETNLIIYTSFVGASFIFLIIRAFGFFMVSLRCTERLHDKMVAAVLQAPVVFFDLNSVGRIMNRFSKDIGCMDEVLPKKFLKAVQRTLLMFTSILLPTVINPWLLFVVVPIAIIAGLISRYYLKTSRELQRLESVSRSPVFSHISETLDGLDTIRTRKKEEDFLDEFCRYQDVHTQAYIMVFATQRWLGVRLDCLSAVLTGAVALAAVFVSQDAVFAGLGLVYIVQSVSMTQSAFKKSVVVETLMTSVERVMTYTELESEPGYKVEQNPPKNWPNEGNIVFKDVSLRYYPGGPQSLKNITLKINGGAKIGIAGRTGAGKSSFVAALMRMPEADGDILIDNVNISSINLQESRRGITVLGQNPALFSGSLRQNLDLMEQFQDTDLWRALEEVQLKSLVENLDGQLDHELLENGANLSVGEGQLICLARVFLHQKKIIILDEPTAHVDPETEQKLWNIVREKLKNSTVITVAHRLNTIRDYDKILLLRNGQVDGFDSFDVVMKNRNGGSISD